MKKVLLVLLALISSNAFAQCHKKWVCDQSNHCQMEQVCDSNTDFASTELAPFRFKPMYVKPTPGGNRGSGSSCDIVEVNGSYESVCH